MLRLNGAVPPNPHMPLWRMHVLLYLHLQQTIQVAQKAHILEQNQICLILLPIYSAHFNIWVLIVCAFISYSPSLPGRPVSHPVSSTRLVKWETANSYYTETYRTGSVTFTTSVCTQWILKRKSVLFLVCLMTGPKPLPIPVPHTMLSSASSFNCQ